MNDISMTTVVRMLVLLGMFSAEVAAKPKDIRAQPKSHSCQPSDHECCWVTQFWKEMKGQKTTYAASSAASCCEFVGSTFQRSGIKGVSCNADGNPTQINWSSKGLSGQIPPEIDMLTNLEYL
jgi:hypothetical protein